MVTGSNSSNLIIIEKYGFNKIIKEMLTTEEVSWLNTYHQKVYEKLSPDLNEEEKKWLQEATAAI